MTQESYSDFSIVQRYVELKNKYDVEVKAYQEKMGAVEQQLRKRIAALEAEILKQKERSKSDEQQIQDLTLKIAEKDEQLKHLGLQLHKIRNDSDPAAGQQDSTKKGKFGLFK